MRFALALNLERMDDAVDMRDVLRHTLEMVQMAEAGGFRVVWAAEHHALEMNIGPNPFQTLCWWSQNTSSIRLGTAVAVAAYWHPIRLAAEAAFVDLVSGGRLDLGIGSGAYQREFDRMRPGLQQPDAWRYLHEMVPAVKALWAGDYAHKGENWSFPTSTSVPKPLQKPHPPIWMTARAPMTYDYAVEHGYNIMCWPLTRPMSEAELYKQRLDDALRKHPGRNRPVFAMMRFAALYDHQRDWEVPIKAAQRALAQFENLFRNLGDVRNGFPTEVPLEELANRQEFEPAMLKQNLMFGTPDEVIAKLKPYEALGVDEFIYYASLGLGHREQKRSLELFCKHVIPAFT